MVSRNRPVSRSRTSFSEVVPICSGSSNHEALPPVIECVNSLPVMSTGIVEASTWRPSPALGLQEIQAGRRLTSKRLKQRSGHRPRSRESGGSTGTGCGRHSWRQGCLAQSGRASDGSSLKSSYMRFLSCSSSNTGASALRIGQHWGPDYHEMRLAAMPPADLGSIRTSGWRERFGIGRVRVVADRGMLSAATMAALEERGFEYILGARVGHGGGARDCVEGREAVCAAAD